MPTTDERREAAAKLRNLEAENHWEKSRFIVGFIEALGLETRASVGECLLHLADLIEPEPERTCLPAYDGRYNNAPKCSICGEILSANPMIRVNYCGGCGARVIGGQPR